MSVKGLLESVRGWRRVSLSLTHLQVLVPDALGAFALKIELFPIGVVRFDAGYDHRLSTAVARFSRACSSFKYSLEIHGEKKPLLQIVKNNFDYTKTWNIHLTSSKGWMGGLSRRSQLWLGHLFERRKCSLTFKYRVKEAV